MEDGAGAYTSDPQFEREVSMSVDLPEAPAQPARLVSINTAQVYLEVLDAQAPRSPRGAEVTVRFVSERLGRPLELTGRVSAIRGGEQGFRLQVELNLDEDGVTWLQARLRTLFNRRRAYRVRPRDNQPIRVRVHDPRKKKSFRALLVDFSIMGLALSVPHRWQEHIERGRELDIRLELPHSGKVIECGVLVRQTRVLSRPPGIRVGVEVLDIAPSSKKLLVEFVMIRQTEERRAGSFQ